MKIFSTLRKQATSFLGQYKQKNPATYAAAEQAIGAALITDGFIGIDNPFEGKKRPGIFGTLGGMILGIIFMLVPVFGGSITNLNNMTAQTTAKVVSVGPAIYTKNVSNNNSSSSGSCPLTVSYSVGGQNYTKQSSISSSSYCSLSTGQTITINYDPANPASWMYGAKTLGMIFKIFFFVGIFIFVSSIITFFIRLLSIIYGWKLLKSGRKNAANLPPGTDLQTLINEIKLSFSKTVFNFGGMGGVASTIQNITNSQPIAEQPTSPNSQNEMSSPPPTSQPNQDPLEGQNNNQTQ